jgi:hypothetical protein
MKFRIEKKESKFTVLDENDVVYGAYDNKVEAEVAVEGWVEYYREDA